LALAIALLPPHQRPAGLGIICGLCLPSFAREHDLVQNDAPVFGCARFSLLMQESDMTLNSRLMIASCWLLFNIGGLAEVVTADEGPFNLLVVMTDEHNFRTLGCYRDTLSPQQALMWGPAVVETPNIDWLAEQGAICTSFYATTPVCSPSRAALFSGRYPQNTPVVTNNIPLDDGIITYAELLRRQGYSTGYAGKWHLDGSGKPQWAPRRKFGFEDNRFMFNRGHWKKFEITDKGPRVAARNATGAPTYAVDGADEKSFSTDFLTDRTIDFIREHRDEPFCYLVSLPDPHGRLTK